MARQHTHETDTLTQAWKGGHDKNKSLEETIRSLKRQEWNLSGAAKQSLASGDESFGSLCKLVLGQQLLQVSGQQLLLHGEANPGPGLAHVCLDLTNVLNVSAKWNQVQESAKSIKNTKQQLQNI